MRHISAIMSELLTTLNNSLAEIEADCARRTATIATLQAENEFSERTAVVIREAIAKLQEIEQSKVDAARANGHAPLLLPPLPQGWPPESKKARVFVAIAKFLAERGGAVHRTEIADHLEELGLAEGVTNPMSAVSRHLSEADGAFVSDNKGSWSLRPFSSSETAGRAD